MQNGKKTQLLKSVFITIFYLPAELFFPISYSKHTPSLYSQFCFVMIYVHDESSNKDCALVRLIASYPSWFFCCTVIFLKELSGYVRIYKQSFSSTALLEIECFSYSKGKMKCKQHVAFILPSQKSSQKKVAYRPGLAFFTYE